MLTRNDDKELFGVASGFTSLGLFYNKHLFDKYQIEYPQNYRSWEETLQTANRFPDEVIGLETNFYRDIALNLVLKIGEINGLSYLNADTFEIDIHTPEWTNIFRQVLQTINTNNLYYYKNEAIEKNRGNRVDRFLNNEVAMLLYTHQTANLISMHNQNVNNQFVDWGVTTIPTSPSHPISFEYKILEIYAIGRESNYIKEAIQLIDFIIEKDLEQSRDRLPVYDERIPNIDGVSLEPLYMLDYRDRPSTFEAVPLDIWQEFNDIASIELEKVLDGENTLEKALEKMEEEGESAILNILMAEENQHP